MDTSKEDRSAKRAASCRAHAEDATGEERKVLLAAADRYERQVGVNKAETHRPTESDLQQSRTYYVIQFYSDLCGQGWTDLDGQLTRGYETLTQAREAFATQWDRKKLALIYGGFRIVERTVTENAFEI
jgi:hypothetical protein